MSLDLLNLSPITSPAIIASPIARMVNAMAMVQSNLLANQSSPSPIELADRAQRRLFAASVLFGVIAALIGAGLALLLWRANNKYQEAVTADANARIEEAKRGAEEARKQAADALRDAALANKEAGKANERAEGLELKAQELEQQNLALRSGVASLEKEAADSKRAYLELRETITPRTLTPQQQSLFIAALKKQPGGKIRLGCASGSEESCIFAQQFLGLFKEAGWSVEGEKVERVVISKPFFGVGIFMLGGEKTPTAQPGIYWSRVRSELQPFFEVLLDGFGQLGIEAKGINDAAFPEHLIGVFFGAKF
jgi:hypothetical protein